MRNLLILASVIPLSWGCAKNKGPASTVDARTARDTEIVLEKCDVESKGATRTDADADGKPELVIVKNGDREVCRTADLNFDGRVDRTTFFDDTRQVRRVESDFDRDGRVDEISVFQAGRLKESHRATTLRGKLDTWEFYENGILVRTERDEDGDGFIDQWWEYPARGCPLIHVDTDGDGRPDPGASIDYCKETGYTPPPVPGEDKNGSTAPDFGSKDARVEETENRAAEGSEVPEQGAAAPAAGETPSTGETKPSTEGAAAP